MTAPRQYLTEAQAREMPYGQLVDRVYRELEGWEARPPRNARQRAAREELARIISTRLTPAALSQHMQETIGLLNSMAARDGGRR